MPPLSPSAPAAGLGSGGASYLLVGMNHQTAPLWLRERLATAEGNETIAALTRLRRLGLEECLWLSTCDRVEVLAAHPAADEAALLVLEALSAWAGLTAEERDGAFQIHIGPAAVRHLFAVTAALESQVVGEPHILGQVKAAHRVGLAAGSIGARLEPLLQAAYGVAKTIRSETAIAEGATSLAAAAVQIGRDLHGDLSRCRLLLLGTGDMGPFLVEAFRETGLGPVTVAAPQERRGQALAQRLEAHAAPFAACDDLLVEADIVVTAVGLGHYLLSGGQIKAALKRRRRRPVFILDVAVPADVDPAVSRVDGAFVYDLADLERFALQGRSAREAAAVAAWAQVETAVAAFLRRQAEREAVPLVVALRSRFEAERQRLLQEAPDLDAAAATRLLLNRLLHRPSAMLRDLAAGADSATVRERVLVERLLRHLFGLEDPPPDASA